MTDPFSLAASSFAVIGSIDTILRAGIGLRRLLSDIEGAPDEVGRLQDCVADNSRLLDVCKKFMEGLRKCSSTTAPPGADLIRVVCENPSFLRSMEREIRSLSALLKKHEKARNSWGKLKWVLNERRITKSLSALAESRSSLNSALVLAGLQLSSLRTGDNEAARKKSSERTDSKIDAQLRTLSSVHEAQKDSSVEQRKILLSTEQQIGQIGRLQKDVANSGHLVRQEHYKTRQHIRKDTLHVIQAVTSKIDELRLTTPGRPSAKQSNREIIFRGDSRESLLASLLPLADPVRWAVLHARSHHTDKFKSEHLDWFRSEFDHLLASATQEAAALSAGSTATSFDQWNYSTGPTSSSISAVQPDTRGSKRSCPTMDGMGRNASGCGEAARRKRLRRDIAELPFDSALGKFRITFSGTHAQSEENDQYHEYNLSFTPSAISQAMQIRFVRSMQQRSNPQICAQINAFNMVEDTETHFYLFMDGTIEDIDRAFRKGVISPYDMDEFGCISIHIAALRGRLDVLHYLDGEGVGLLSLREDFCALASFWENLIESQEDDTPIDSLFPTWHYLEGYLSKSYCASAVLPATSWGEMRCSQHFDTALTKKWVKMLQDECYDLEWKLPNGFTPLLDHLSKPGGQCLALVRLLLECGAEVHAKDTDGSNAIHVAMSSKFSWDEYTHLLEEKLVLLLEAGVDIHHRNNSGITPSRGARYSYYCWDEWCRALELTGLSIRDVVRADDELSLLEMSDDDEEYCECDLMEGACCEQCIWEESEKEESDWDTTDEE